MNCWQALSVEEEFGRLRVQKWVIKSSERIYNWLLCEGSVLQVFVKQRILFHAGCRTQLAKGFFKYFPHLSGLLKGLCCQLWRMERSVSATLALNKYSLKWHQLFCSTWAAARQREMIQLPKDEPENVLYVFYKTGWFFSLRRVFSYHYLEKASRWTT